MGRHTENCTDNEFCEHRTYVRLESVSGMEFVPLEDLLHVLNACEGYLESRGDDADWYISRACHGIADTLHRVAGDEEIDKARKSPHRGRKTRRLTSG